MSTIASTPMSAAKLDTVVVDDYIASKVKESLTKQLSSVTTPTLPPSCPPDKKVSAMVDWSNDPLQVLPKPKLVRTSRPLSATRQMMKPITVKMPYSFTFVNTGSQVCATSLPVDVSSATEFASCAALYDEFRLSLVETQHAFCQSSGTLSPNAMLVMAYDPSDSNAVSSTRAGCELARHKLFVPTIATSTAVSQYPKGEPMCFSASLKPSETITEDSSGKITSLPGSWVSVDNPLPQGFLKVYWENSGASAATAIAGIAFLTVQFRSRK